ncbi:unnamed protein product [Cuscuta campestris]|uniref:Uncharacterized protein n=1 Tax=Cuscuta campestris TaxID=132261 RepID=A0A484N2R6_9ASTE|nr:unnamed protein product [Cuscuta campestris]
MDEIFLSHQNRIVRRLYSLFLGCYRRSDKGKEEDGKEEEESVVVDMVDPSSFEGVDHNEEEEIKDGKEEDELVNMVDPSNFEGIPEEKEEEEGDQFNLNEEEEVKNRSPPTQEEEEEKFTLEGEAIEDEMATSDKIVHDVVEFCKSTENNVDEELGRGLREKKRSSNELDKAEEVQLNKRRNPSSQQLEAFHQFMQSTIADGREVQCIIEKRGESHGIVNKWWSSLIKAGG